MGVGIVILGVSSWMLYQMMSFRAGDRLFPLVFAAPVFALVVLELGVQVRSRVRRSTGSNQFTLLDFFPIPSQMVNRKRLGEMFLWMIGLATAVWLVGMAISLPLFVLAYLILHRVRWGTIFGLTISIWAIVYLVFQRLMQQTFPEPILHRFLGV